MILTVVLIEEEISMCSELLRQLFIILSGNRKNPHARMQNPAAATAAEYQKPVLKNSQANQNNSDALQAGFTSSKAVL